MNTSKYAAIAILAFGSLVALPQKAAAQSQAEMNQEAAANFEKADKELNVVYKRLASKIDKESQEKLKTTQKAWVAFRDAEADLIADFDARGGSMAPMIYSGRRAELTKARTEQLRKILKEYAE